jgi:hypothetical protein
MAPLAALLAGILAQAPGPAFAVTIEPRVESLRYRFDNPSSFDTTELVPHVFEQTYDTNHLWLGTRVRFRIANLRAEAMAALAPSRTGQADDLDTFFQPDGNVIVSGTIGNASLRAWEAGQRVVVGEAHTIAYGLGYSYRRDSARFHEGTKIVTTSVPPSELREIVTTREFVTSQIHQLHWFARWSPDRSPVSVVVDAAPLAIGRLGIELPDKYPGRTLVFQSRAAVFSAETAITGSIGSMALEVALSAHRSLSYSPSARMRLQGASIVVRAGTR